MRLWARVGKSCFAAMRLLVRNVVLYSSVIHLDCGTSLQCSYW
jgi:hypothetical protein